jgi:anti-sigma B factor antagonist
MDMTKRDRNGVVVFDLEGELRGGPVDDAAFKGGVQQAVEEGARHVLLNLSGLKWINSTGLGFIVAVYHTMREVDGDLKMCEANERIAHIFTTTRFDKVIGIYPSEEEALSSFAG